MQKTRKGRQSGYQSTRGIVAHRMDRGSRPSPENQTGDIYDGFFRSKLLPYVRL